MSAFDATTGWFLACVLGTLADSDAYSGTAACMRTDCRPRRYLDFEGVLVVRAAGAALDTAWNDPNGDPLRRAIEERWRAPACY